MLWHRATLMFTFAVLCSDVKAALGWRQPAASSASSQTASSTAVPAEAPSSQEPIPKVKSEPTESQWNVQESKVAQ